MQMRRDQLSLAVLSALAVILIALGLYVVGSPSDARAARRDGDRVDNLNQIATCLQALPKAEFEALPQGEGDAVLCQGTRHLRDPVTDKPYRQTRLPDMGFKVCADLETSHPPVIGYLRDQFDPDSGCLTSRWNTN